MRNIKVGLFNAGSLNTGQDEFIVALEDLCPDIMAINETWLGKGHDEKAPKVTGYRIVHRPRPNSIKNGRGGGVGFYIRRGINARVLPHPEVVTVEQLWLRLCVAGKCVIIGTAYRPPDMQDIDGFFDAITETIISFAKCDHVIFLGDLNINTLVPGCKLNLLEQFLQSMNLKQIITEPTHFTCHGGTLIDLVCTDAGPRNITIKHTPELGNHAMIVAEFNIKRERIPARFVTYRPLKDIILELFSADLNSINWEFFETDEDVNVMVSFLTSTILTLFNLHAPLKTTKFKHPPHPWITDTIRDMMKTRDRYFSRYRRTKSVELKTCYKDIKYIVEKAVESEKAAFFTDNVNNNKYNSKLLWTNLKKNILPNKKSNAEIPVHLNNPSDINAHFLNVPGANNVNISMLTYYEHHRYGTGIFTLQPVSEFTILKIIESFKSNAQGIDGISLEMLLLTLPQSLPSITTIINKSLSSGIFPDAWKVAIVKPIPKNNQPSSFGELRPISLLSCISKILEKVVSVQMVKFLEDHQILPKLQSGFRKNHSTSTALLDVVDNLLAAQDRGLCSILVLLDFTRAFDSINITLLLSKLTFYGFDIGTIKWFCSYLSYRSQCVELMSPAGGLLRSSLEPVVRGVPQGSILGPILFTLYSADIVKDISHSKYHLYADDVQLYHSFLPSDASSAVKEINSDLNTIFKWSMSNSLNLNPLKSKYLLISTKANLKKLNTADLNININGEPVQRVEEALNLGLTMDSKLRFESHVANNVRHCFYRLKILYKIRPYLCESIRITLCESLVLSKLNYVDVVYGPCLLSRSEKLIQRVQNACARFCFSIPPRTHVSPYLNSAHMLKMKARRTLHLAILLFGLTKSTIPSYLQSKLTWAKSNSRYIRRECTSVFVTPKHRTVAFRGSFRFASSKCWNDLPPPLRTLQSIFSFRNKVRKYLFDIQKRG